RHEHCRLRQGGDSHLPARSHPAKSRTDIHPRQSGEKPDNCKEHDQGDNIGGVGKRKVDGDEGDDPPDQDVNSENDIGGETEYPRGVLRQDHFLGEELDDVPVGLEYSRISAPLHEALERFYPSRKSRGGQEKDKELESLCYKRRKIYHPRNTSSTI